jgi:hypothetical protein
MIPGESFYTISEVAEILKVTKPTIRNYIKKGGFKGEKFSGNGMSRRIVLENIWVCGTGKNNLIKYLDEG